MNRFKGFLSFVLIAAIFGFALRLLHVLVPLAYPSVLQGPFSLDDAAEVEQYCGFSPLVPFYRPEVLGESPINITAYRRPPRVVFFWQGEKFLWVEQTLDGEMVATPLDAVPLEGLAKAEAVSWRRGATVHLAARIDRFIVELRTDLSAEDARRIIDSMRPFEEVR